MCPERFEVTPHRPGPPRGSHAVTASPGVRCCRWGGSWLLSVCLPRPDASWGVGGRTETTPHGDGSWTTRSQPCWTINKLGLEDGVGRSWQRRCNRGAAASQPGRARTPATPRGAARLSELQAAPCSALCLVWAESQQAQVVFPGLNNSFRIWTCGLGFEQVLPVGLHVDAFPEVLNVPYVSRKTINACIWDGEGSADTARLPFLLGHFQEKSIYGEA